VRRGDDVGRRDERAGALEGTVDEDVGDVGILARLRVVTADDGLRRGGEARRDGERREKGAKQWHGGSNDTRAHNLRAPQRFLRLRDNCRGENRQVRSRP
jgi:hypothetical protein